MSFTPITTQEELDKIISGRLTREREAIAKKYADYDDLKRRADDAEAHAADLSRQLEEADARQAQHEKTVGDLTHKLIASRLEFARFEVAQEYGLPPTLAARLTGATKAELAADAEYLLRMLKRGSGRSALGTSRSASQTGYSDDRAAIKEMLREMKSDLD